MLIQNHHEAVTALTWLPVDRVIGTLASLIDSHGHRTRELARPRGGLSLLTVRDGALGQRWHVGEILVSSAHVRVEDPDGRQADGGACVLADDPALARALAAADAILRDHLAGWEELQSLAEEGSRARGREMSVRHAMLERTKVDFHLLAEGREED